MNALYYTLSVAWKELQLIVRDRGSLAVLFLLPLLLGSVTGAINLQLSRSGDDPTILLTVCLVNQDDGMLGEQVEAALGEIDELEILPQDTVAEAEERVAQGEASAAIMIPSGFTQQIDSYIPTTIEVIVDPGDMQGAEIVAGMLNQVASEVTIWGEVQYGVRAILEESGALVDAPPEVQRAIALQTVGAIMTQFNELRQSPTIVVRSQNLVGATVEGGIELFFAFMFPGFTVMFAFFAVGTAAEALLKERESGTFRRLLAAPIPRAAVIAGKMLAYMVIVCLQVVVLFAVGNLIFGMPLGQAPGGLIVLTVVLSLVVTALGMLVASLARTAKQAGDVGTLLGFVLAAFGGALPLSGTPITRSEGFFSALTRFTPHAHAVEGYYSLMAENAGLTQVLPEIGFLVLFGVVFYLIAVWRFRFE